MVRVRNTVTTSATPHRPTPPHLAAAGIRGLHAHSSAWSTHHASRGLPAGAATAAARGMPATAGAATIAVKGGFDGPINAPWRKTVSIFKQPVTLVRTTSRDTRPAPANEIQAATSKNGRTDKPKQVFWAKRLGQIAAMAPLTVAELMENEETRLIEAKEKEDEDSDTAIDRDSETDRKNRGTPHIEENPSESLSLPNRISPVGPDIPEAVAAASLVSALQSQTSGGSHQPPITGQTNPKKHLDSNPGVYTNPDQPMIHAVVVSDQDITVQERRVLDARRRLEEARKHFGS